MVLPAPNLDDRRFQQLVDDAKRMVTQRCPEWTDHNVSDPGVTLIETFAFMVDQLLYRLNRLPDRLYVKFLDLLGIRLFPPTAASVDVTFWLSAPQPTSVRIARDTQVATVRTDVDEAVAFSTVADLDIVVCDLLTVTTTDAAGDVRKRLAQLRSGHGFYCFGREPQPGDALLVGLTRAVPSCALRLDARCEIEGIGVDPDDPPLAWEAWNGLGWSPCEVDGDETGGLNRAGQVVLHVPPDHVASVIAGDGAGWLRARVQPPRDGQPRYSASPRIVELAAATIGGTTRAVNAERVDDEILGTSEGVPGQNFSLRRAPVVAAESRAVVDVATYDGWEAWDEVDSFADSGAGDRHFVLDRVTGEVTFGPAVREADGTLRHYGAVPPKGAVLRIRSYRSGGGRGGNVARRAISVLRSSIPYVSRVENRAPATGGVDGESVAEAKLRGPIVLRTRGRAVTADDFETLAREATLRVGRARCVEASGPADSGFVRVLIVPALGDRVGGPLRFDELQPDAELLSIVAAHLDERRVIGTRVVVEPPYYQGVTVVARLRAHFRAKPERLERDALAALHRHFDPLVGGHDGTGWPFGRTVNLGEVFAVLQRVEGVALVEEVLLFAADAVTGKRGSPTDRIAIEPNGLPFSYRPQVRVEAG